MAYAAYIVVAIGVGRARRTQFNWVVTGSRPRVNVALNLALIPAYGMMGAAIATVAAYATMAIGMALVVAAHLPRAVPVAARRDGGARRGRRSPRGQARRGLAGAIALIAATPSR